APFNDLEAVKAIFQKYPQQVAAIIVEPVAGNMGLVLPTPGFLEGLRELTDRYGSLLIFDEVITGFRLTYGGAQNLFGVMPDLTCLGKIIGGGLPVGAYGGKREIMEMIAPAGPVYQAGTLSGNPLAMAAGITTLSVLARPGVYTELERISTLLAEGIADAAKRTGAPVSFNRIGSMMCTFFTPDPVVDFKSAVKSDTEQYGKFFHRLLDEGIYIAPAQFEAMFVSTAHSEEDIEVTVEAIERALTG
ncbi:MAG: aminotransferase class III-fold pyridoxal phosphate-dependent enzyme, partial [Eubacteriales bacterium]|nr:aminotransferase class III-fold pyridoxal phosphate-dependent enzyme [Eubacteriales bacterium]